MITFPKFTDFNPDQQKFIKDSLSSFAKFEWNLARVTAKDFIEAFGSSEGERLWNDLQQSNMNLTKFGQEHFNDDQKKAMVKHIKNMQTE